MSFWDWDSLVVYLAPLSANISASASLSATGTLSHGAKAIVVGTTTVTANGQIFEPSRAIITATSAVFARATVVSPQVQEAGPDDRNNLVGTYAVYGKRPNIISLQFIYERTIYSKNQLIRRDIVVKMPKMEREEIDVLPNVSLEKIINGKGKAYHSQKQRRDVPLSV